MEELVEKVTGKVSVKKEERPTEKEKASPVKAISPVAKENKDLPKSEETGSKPQKKGSDLETGKAKRKVPWMLTPQTVQSLLKPRSPMAAATWVLSRTIPRSPLLSTH